ncbi:ParB/RepB/Spo0J family partition protein [uncultured Algimonas sp.]|uniref:ParB/RepB/Spo0J family partition protein n=1 Tax=uncultured Algimonas sp. TaxID=1547920 RepID=UPI00260AAE31|nr:ParB/RepB/Spo0J family partition protein [uncultured Algimonas sp.]
MSDRKQGTEHKTGPNRKTGPARRKGLGRGLSALMNDAGLQDANTAQTQGDVDERPLEIKGLGIAMNYPIDPPGDKTSALVDPPRDEDAPREQPGVRNVAISRLVRNTAQPRKRFATAQLDDLIASIQQKGILQPILVRRIDADAGDRDGADYQIVAGERRWRAALKAGLTSVPIIVRELSDRDVLEIGVVENVQRADLNPLEEALAYEQLINEFGRTQAEIATTIGKSRVHVANTVRLTGLSERARELLLDGKITAGHARALLAAEDPDALAEAIVKNDLSVRDAERWVRAEKAPQEVPARKGAKPADIVALERKIGDLTGYAADIRHKAKGGEIRFKYKDLDQLETFLKRLGIS